MGLLFVVGVKIIFDLIGETDGGIWCGVKSVRGIEIRVDQDFSFEQEKIAKNILC